MRQALVNESILLSLPGEIGKIAAIYARTWIHDGEEVSFTRLLQEIILVQSRIEQDRQKQRSGENWTPDDLSKSQYAIDPIHQWHQPSTVAHVPFSRPVMLEDMAAFNQKLQEEIFKQFNQPNPLYEYFKKQQKP